MPATVECCGRHGHRHSDCRGRWHRRGQGRGSAAARVTAAAAAGAEKIYNSDYLKLEQPGSVLRRGHGVTQALGRHDHDPSRSSCTVAFTQPRFQCRNSLGRRLSAQAISTQPDQGTVTQRAVRLGAMALSL